MSPQCQALDRCYVEQPSSRCGDPHAERLIIQHQLVGLGGLGRPQYRTVVHLGVVRDPARLLG